MTTKRTKSNNRIREKKKRNHSIKLNKQQKTIAVIVLVVLILVGATYGRRIIKLKMENAALKQQQEELKAEKSARTKEYQNINSEDYIREQARKKLRLLNKDEKIYNFEGDSGEEN